MTRNLLFTIACGAWFFCETIALGQGMGGMGGRMGPPGGGPPGRDHPRPFANRDDIELLPEKNGLTPHGGEYLMAKPNHYEIVYLPLEARIYLFDDKMKPITARDVRAEMSFNVPPQKAPQKIPFQYVAKSSPANDQDYLVAAFDFRQLPNAQIPITVACSGLPESTKFLGFWDRHNESASFTSSFRPAKIRPYVARGMLTVADQERFRRQQVCPVSGRKLGIEKQAIKLYVGDYPLYLAGEDCIAAVKQSPEKYVPRSVGQTPSASSSR